MLFSSAIIHHVIPQWDSNRRTLIINGLDRWNLYVRLDGPDTYGHLSTGVRRPPRIGQQGGRRLNTRLSLADHFEYLNLKNDTVAHICAQ